MRAFPALHHGGAGALRIELSRALSVIRQVRAGINASMDDRPAASVVGQLGKLAAMLESGLFDP